MLNKNYSSKNLNNILLNLQKAKTLIINPIIQIF